MSRTSECLNTALEVSGYMMIESLHVENFRSFKSLELHGLRRINIIVGNNASGKTVLLEAIKLGLGAGPTIIPFLNQLRGIQMFFTQNPTAEQFQSYFIDLFHDFGHQKAIAISTVDSTHRNAELRIFFDPTKAVTAQQPALGFQPASSSPPPSTIVPLAFDRVDFNGVKNTYYATTTGGQVLLQPAPEMGIVSGFFSGSYFGVGPENAAWLSKLSVEKRSGEVIESIRRHFPFIRGVTSETILPGVGSVYVDVPYLSRKLPLSLVSGGISRLFTLMLAILTFEKGVVLVDEIENGMFHAQYSSVWKTLAELARHHDTQLFISTHSKECLKAALPTIAEYQEDFTLLRTHKKESESEIEVFGGTQLEAALEKNGEVRD
jgi:AAA domain, putative AbiEii toxin, Type IV TA system/AAA domain